MGTKVTPYQSTEERAKKEQVEEMFDNIAHSYDFLNHFFSLGIDKIWRNKAIKILKNVNHKRILDVATGTGDFAIQILKRGLKPTKIIGVDISQGMLDVGDKKIAKKGMDSTIELRKGDSENLPFKEGEFDAFTVAFGVRNFQNLEKGLTDMNRVLKSGGTGIILEFSKPKSFPMKQLFGFYFKFIMPTIGKIVSKDSRAYTYLPESVQAFPEGSDFLEIMKNCGYLNCQQKKLSGGISSIYWGQKA